MTKTAFTLFSLISIAQFFLNADSQSPAYWHSNDMSDSPSRYSSTGPPPNWQDRTADNKEGDAPLLKTRPTKSGALSMLRRARKVGSGYSQALSSPPPTAAIVRHDRKAQHSTHHHHMSYMTPSHTAANAAPYPFPFERSTCRTVKNPNTKSHKTLRYPAEDCSMLAIGRREDTAESITAGAVKRGGKKPGLHPLTSHKVAIRALRETPRTQCCSDWSPVWEPGPHKAKEQQILCCSDWSPIWEPGPFQALEQHVGMAALCEPGTCFPIHADTCHTAHSGLLSIRSRGEDIYHPTTLKTCGNGFQTTHSSLKRADAAASLRYFQTTPTFRAKKLAFHPIGAGGFARHHAQLSGASGETGENIPVILEGIALKGNEHYPTRAVQLSDKHELIEHCKQVMSNLPGVEMREGPEFVGKGGRDARIRMVVASSSLQSLLVEAPRQMGNMARIPADGGKIYMGCPDFRPDVPAAFPHSAQIRIACRIHDAELGAVAEPGQEMGDVARGRALLKAAAWEMALGDCIREDRVHMFPDASTFPKKWDAESLSAPASKQGTPAVQQLHADTTEGEQAKGAKRARGSGEEGCEGQHDDSDLGRATAMEGAGDNEREGAEAGRSQEAARQLDFTWADPEVVGGTTARHRLAAELDKGATNLASSAGQLLDLVIPVQYEGGRKERENDEGSISSILFPTHTAKEEFLSSLPIRITYEKIGEIYITIPLIPLSVKACCVMVFPDSPHRATMGGFGEALVRCMREGVQMWA